MSLFNTPVSYGSVTKILHWVTALLIITLLTVGFTMGGIKDLPVKFTVYGLHKSLGVTVLLLVLARAAWHVYSRRPDPVETLSPRDRRGAAGMHYLLYALMILMPLSGWAMSSAFGRPVSFFGLFTLPDFVAPDPDLGKALAARHRQIAWVIIVAVSLHAGAALWHHFVRKDAVLRRMLPALLFTLLLAPPAAARAEVPTWTVQHEKSSLSFRPKQMGAEFKGVFDVFAADIAFDPDDLEKSKVTVTIQVPSAHTGAPDRDENLKAPDWFDTTKFPAAKFESTAFRREGEGRYVADGTLTIKGVTLPVVLPFTLAITKRDDGFSTAVVDGTVTLDRSKFNVGVGQWADVSIIANEVPVDVHLTALARR